MPQVSLKSFLFGQSVWYLLLVDISCFLWVLKTVSNCIIKLCTGLIANIYLSRPWDLYISANWTTGKTKDSSTSAIILWSFVEVFHCWWLGRVRTLFWYGNVWSFCISLVIFEEVISPQETHMEGYVGGCHPRVH